jgi:hypothetical protein
MKTENQFGYESAEWTHKNEGTTGQVDISAICNSTSSIPDGDYAEMVGSGIENPSPRAYWTGYNEYMATLGKNPAAVFLGRKGGSAKSEAKATAARANATKPRKTPLVWWTAKNNSSFLDGHRSAASMRSAVIAARAYLAGELYGEGTITYYDSNPSDGVPYPVREDEKSLQTGHKWVIRTDF